MKVYEKGRVKVVWVGADSEVIYSKMFTTVDKAIRFSSKKEDYLIFKLIYQQNMEEFCWELLPFGKYKLYQTIIQTYKKPKTTLNKLMSDLLP